MQPALRMGDHGHRIAGAADRKTLRFEPRNQRRDLVGRVDHEFDIGAGRKTQEAVGIGVGDVAQLANGVDIHLPLGAGAHRPHFLAALGYVMQNTRARPLVPLPRPVIPPQQRMHEGQGVDNAAFDRSTL
jgi:hypothetical protein